MTAALSMTDAESENEKRSKLLNSKGIILLEQSLYKDALVSFQEALLLSQKEDHRIGMIESLVNMSLIEHLLGKLHDARQRVIRAFALAQESADPVSIAACSVNQAELEFKLANYELGKRLNEKAGKIYKELDHSQGITYFLENQAHLSMVQGNLEHAFDLAHKASSLATEKGLKKRRLELLRIESNIQYLIGHYEDGRRTLDLMTQKSKEIGDLMSEADAQFRLGVHFMRLNDLARALPHWQLLMNVPDDRLSAELCFLKSSVKAFQACLEKNEPELQNCQREMKKLADATDYSYLIIGTSVLCVHQMECLNRVPEALRFAEDAERQALYYNQDVWLPRVRIKIFELQKILLRPPSIPKVYELLDMAKAQSQNHIVHACYQLLWEIDPQFEDLQKAWRSHWENWKSQIPEEYRTSLQPSVD